MHTMDCNHFLRLLQHLADIEHLHRKEDYDERKHSIYRGRP